MSKELKALDYIIKEFLSYEIPNDAPNCVKELESIRKALKALDIIKSKHLYWSIDWQPYEQDNDYRAWDNELYQSAKLTKEEYELLKEILEK